MKLDPLAAIAKAEENKNCKHPHLQFGRSAYQLKCIDCKRRWVTAWVDVNGMDTEMPDLTYSNSSVTDQEFRHTPNELPRQAKK